jgi:hypothetical protein
MAGLQMDLAREEASDSMVPLAESETPMIRKNKELREAQSRRSSLGMRGHRASTSLGRGDASKSGQVGVGVGWRTRGQCQTLISRRTAPIGRLGIILPPHLINYTRTNPSETSTSVLF